MEEELLDLVADHSEALVQLFCHNGVQTCQDVFGIWSHGDELVAELERLQGPLDDAEEAFQVSALWTLAARRAHDHIRRVARAVAGNRLPVVETGGTYRGGTSWPCSAAPGDGVPRAAAYAVGCGGL